MEKLRLKNGTEFEMVPMGFDATSNTKRFVFISELTHGEIKELLVGTNEIDYVLADGSCISYIDIMGLISLEDNIQNGTYTAIFSTDAIAKSYADLQVEITNLHTENNNLKLIVDELLISSLEV